MDRVPLSELVRLAHEHGIEVDLRFMETEDLIHQIQRARGQQPCYRNPQQGTCVGGQIWCSECRRLRSAWRR